MGAGREIPRIVLSGEALGADRGSEEWKALIKQVREACETYGCFVVVDYPKVPIEMQQQLLSTTKQFFDLPLERKLPYTKPIPRMGGYAVVTPSFPINESLGVYGDEEARAFEKFIWPEPEETKPRFSEVINSTNAKIVELNLLILSMIYEGFGLGDYYKSEGMEDKIFGKFHAMKYKLPQCNEEEAIGLKNHVDHSILTIICQNSVQGLEALTQDGQNWIPISIPSGGFVVNVGDALQVMTNRRLQAVKHRVIMTRGKERHTCTFFSLPKEGVTIEVSPPLVDKEHPLLYRPVVYSEYLDKCLANDSLDALQVYGYLI